MTMSLITGGARSGKSDLAERMAAASGRPVLFVATMEPRDDEMRSRIDAHRASRPRSWRTVEEPIDVVAALASHSKPGDFVVVDCVTLWISNLMLATPGDAEEIAPDAARDGIAECERQAAAFADWCVAFDGDVAIVTNEVGMGLVPPYPLGRAFRDALGTVNRLIAARADRVYYLVAGLALELKALGAQPLDAFGEAPQP
jgi:adenosylcobinamide kinase/adenosylcobinamide-phosphate guanylyltransferase